MQHWELQGSAIPKTPDRAEVCAFQSCTFAAKHWAETQCPAKLSMHFLWNIMMTLDDSVVEMRVVYGKLAKWVAADKLRAEMILQPSLRHQDQAAVWTEILFL